MNNHNMKKQSAVGHGRWLQCEDCGMTHYKKMFYFAGFKSEVAPPCNAKNYKEWGELESTVRLTDKDLSDE